MRRSIRVFRDTVRVLSPLEGVLDINVVSVLYFGSERGDTIIVHKASLPTLRLRHVLPNLFQEEASARRLFGKFLLCPGRDCSRTVPRARGRHHGMTERQKQSRNLKGGETRARLVWTISVDPVPKASKDPCVGVTVCILSPLFSTRA